MNKYYAKPIKAIQYTGSNVQEIQSEFGNLIEYPDMNGGLSINMGWCIHGVPRWAFISKNLTGEYKGYLNYLEAPKFNKLYKLGR